MSSFFYIFIKENMLLVSLASTYTKSLYLAGLTQENGYIRSFFLVIFSVFYSSNFQVDLVLDLAYPTSGKDYIT